MPDNTTQETVKFGLGQISKETPSWAKWVFRLFFYTTSTVGLYLTVFTQIPSDLKLEILKGVTFANAAMHGLSKMFGVKEEPTDYYSK